MNCWIDSHFFQCMNIILVAPLPTNCRDNPSWCNFSVSDGGQNNTRLKQSDSDMKLPKLSLCVSLSLLSCSGWMVKSRDNDSENIQTLDSIYLTEVITLKPYCKF